MRRVVVCVALGSLCCGPAWAAKKDKKAADNTLTRREKKDGWVLLFDGTLKGWMTNDKKPSQRPVEENSLNPHKCGGYLLVHEKEWSDFILALDFKISKGCNSGIYLRTNPLVPGEDVGYNGLEMQILDSTNTDYHDTGAIYDLVKAKKNTMKPAGEWNHVVITCKDNLVDIELNGEKVNHMDLNEWPEKSKRPDGSRHKFKQAWKDHPRRGYIGLQDHNHDCWFKNIKLKPLGKATTSQPAGK